MEGDPDLHEACVSLIDAEGLEVLAARDATHGLELALQRRAQLGLLLLDWRMPGISAEDLLVGLGEAFTDEVPTPPLLHAFDATLGTCCAARARIHFSRSAALMT